MPSRCAPLLHRRQDEAADQRERGHPASNVRGIGIGAWPTARYCRELHAGVDYATAPGVRMAGRRTAPPLWRASDRRATALRSRIDALRPAQLRAVMRRSNRDGFVDQRRRWRPTPPAGVTSGTALASRGPSHRASAARSIQALTFAQTMPAPRPPAPRPATSKPARSMARVRDQLVTVWKRHRMYHGHRPVPRREADHQNSVPYALCQQSGVAVGAPGETATHQPPRAGTSGDTTNSVIATPGG